MAGRGRLQEVQLVPEGREQLRSGEADAAQDLGDRGPRHQRGVYLSLVQANSNSSVMELYYSTLIKLLDKKQPGWRSSTIILTDNAPTTRARRR